MPPQMLWPAQQTHQELSIASTRSAAIAFPATSTLRTVAASMPPGCTAPSCFAQACIVLHLRSQHGSPTRCGDRPCVFAISFCATPIRKPSSYPPVHKVSAEFAEMCQLVCVMPTRARDRLARIDPFIKCGIKGLCQLEALDATFLFATTDAVSVHQPDRQQLTWPSRKTSHGSFSLLLEGVNSPAPGQLLMRR